MNFIVYEKLILRKTSLEVSKETYLEYSHVYFCVLCSTKCSMFYVLCSLLSVLCSLYSVLYCLFYVPCSMYTQGSIGNLMNQGSVRKTT